MYGLSGGVPRLRAPLDHKKNGWWTVDLEVTLAGNLRKLRKMGFLAGLE
jgi:hypothetical protein